MKSLEAGMLHIYVQRMCVQDVLENIMLVLVSSQPSVQAGYSSVQPTIFSIQYRIQSSVQSSAPLSRSVNIQTHWSTFGHIWCTVQGHIPVYTAVYILRYCPVQISYTVQCTVQCLVDVRLSPVYAHCLCACLLHVHKIL